MNVVLQEIRQKFCNIIQILDKFIDTKIHDKTIDFSFTFYLNNLVRSQLFTFLRENQKIFLSVIRLILLQI